MQVIKQRYEGRDMHGPLTIRKDIAPKDLLHIIAVKRFNI